MLKKIIAVKAPLHGAIFLATCLATPLRDKLHNAVQCATCCAMVKIVARQVAPIVAQSRIGFYFLQRLQQFFSALHRVTPFQQLISQCFHNNDCERMPLPSLLAFIEKSTQTRCSV